MTNTKFRKRALLSSVAMLLVALVALGSATFAWFTTNRAVTSQGFNGKAASSVGLKILSESDAGVNSKSVTTIGDYKNNTTLFTNKSTSQILSPVSLVPSTSGVSAFTTTAVSDTNGARNVEGAAVTPVTAPSAWDSDAAFYMEKVYVALTGSNSSSTVSQDIKFDNLTCTWGSDTIASAARLVVLYTNASGTSIVGQYAKNAETTAEITAVAEAGTASTTSDVAYTAISTPAASNTYSVSSTAGDCYFTVLVYLDGQDTDCTSANVRASDVISNVILNVSLAA